jgi:hypothetical protein
VPATFEGTSLRQRVLGSDGKTEASLTWFSQVGLNDAAPGRDLLAVGVDGWRYMMDRRSDWQALYDAAGDPSERDDRSGEQRDVVSRPRGVCQDFLARHARAEPVESVAADPALAERLRRLGYLATAERSQAP